MKIAVCMTIKKTEDGNLSDVGNPGGGWRRQRPAQMEKRQIKDSAAKFLEHEEFVYLIVTLKKIPQTNRTKPYQILLHYPLITLTEESLELCLIIDDRPKSGLTKEDAKKKIKSENIPITKLLKLSKLKTGYRPCEAKRKLCDSNEVLFADRRVIPLLSRLIGKKFFTRKKILMVIDLKHKNWKEHIEKACGSTMFFSRTGIRSVIKVGKLSMKSSEIAENVMETSNGVVEIFTKKCKNVRSLHLKLTESLALPIYQVVPDLKLKIDGIGTEKKSGVKEGKKGESSDDVGVVVDSSESSEKSVSVKGKKKKGRIYEVRCMDSNVSKVLDEDEVSGDFVEENEIIDPADKKKIKKKKEMSIDGSVPRARSLQERRWPLRSTTSVLCYCWSCFCCKTSNNQYMIM